MLELRYTTLAAGVTLGLLALWQGFERQWFIFVWDGIASLLMFGIAAWATHKARE